LCQRGTFPVHRFQEISLSAFFENPFVEDLALLILQEVMEQQNSRDLDEVLARVEMENLL
jgi:hypothetical protein